MLKVFWSAKELIELGGIFPKHAINLAKKLTVH